MKLKALKAAFPLTLPVLTGYLFLGIAYGLLMSNQGFSIVWTVLISSAVFAGALQFASITLLTSAFNPIAALLLALLVNIRHIFYGIALLGKYRNIGVKKNFMIFSLADEAFSINVAAQPPSDVDSGWYYFFVNLLSYSYWQLACFSGHLLGAWLPDDIIGLDFVLTALFFVLFLNQWKKKENRKNLLIGVFATALSLVFVSRTQFLLVAMIVIVALIFIFDPIKGESHEQ
jgi:4-azaleucine resistance transporter AzlC